MAALQPHLPVELPTNRGILEPGARWGALVSLEGFRMHGLGADSVLQLSKV